MSPTTMSPTTMSPTTTAPPNDQKNGAARPIGRDEVMEAVLTAATDLFAEKGPTGVTVREIALQAGVNHALIHRHFGTKDELLRIVLAQSMERMTLASAGLATTGADDVAPIIEAVLREQTGVRLLAWAILTGYPLETIWPKHPTVELVRAVLAHEQEGAAPTPGAPPREDPRVATAAAAALLMGWAVFEPFLDRAAGLGEIAGFDAAAAINHNVQSLFDRAR